MTISHIYDILLSRGKSSSTKNPIDKGKPFERMGHKALEPKSPEGPMVVSCQKDNTKKLNFEPILRWKNGLFLLSSLCPKRAQMFQAQRREK